VTFEKRFELVAPLLPDVESLVPDMRAALEARWLTEGQFVRRLELRMTEVVGDRHVVAVGNATAGLMVGLRALGWQGEVITPAFGFAGTAHAIVWSGCEPVLAEVDRDTFALDPASVARLKGPRTAGVLPVDPYGVPANLDALGEATGDVPILVDSAHSLGSTPSFHLRPDLRVFSLHPTKTIVAGEGGLVTTDDADLADRVRRIKNFGFGRGQDAEAVGLNAKLPELSAILAFHQVDLLERTIAGRRDWDRAYRAALADVSGIAFQRIPEPSATNHQYTAVRIDRDAFGRSRDEVAAALLERNVATRPYFSPPIHLMAAYRGRLRTDDLRWTEELSASVLCLPVHPGESPALAEEIAGMIRSLRR
jgi:dTDP-4-amino-4,6-dideoxygalactose transaminase